MYRWWLGRRNCLALKHGMLGRLHLSLQSQSPFVFALWCRPFWISSGCFVSSGFQLDSTHGNPSRSSGREWGQEINAWPHSLPAEVQGESEVRHLSPDSLPAGSPWAGWELLNVFALHTTLCFCFLEAFPFLPSFLPLRLGIVSDPASCPHLFKKSFF